VIPDIGNAPTPQIRVGGDRSQPLWNGLGIPPNAVLDEDLVQTDLWISRPSGFDPLAKYAYHPPPNIDVGEKVPAITGYTIVDDGNVYLFHDWTSYITAQAYIRNGHRPVNHFQVNSESQKRIQEQR